MEIFLRVIRDDLIWGDLFYTEIMTGLRRGEICGLKWNDFDPGTGKLKVRRTLHGDDGITEGDPKTYNGRRTILLPTSVTELLRRRKKTAISEWMFPNPMKPEDPVAAASVYNRLKQILRKAGLPSVSFHDLRHTFATQAVECGVDPKTLSCLLGHAKASFSLDRYTHVTADMQKNAADAMDGFYENLIGEEVRKWEDERKGPAE